MLQYHINILEQFILWVKNWLAGKTWHNWSITAITCIPIIGYWTFNFLISIHLLVFTSYCDYLVNLIFSPRVLLPISYSYIGSLGTRTFHYYWLIVKVITVKQTTNNHYLNYRITNTEMQCNLVGFIINAITVNALSYLENVPSCGMRYLICWAS